MSLNDDMEATAYRTQANTHRVVMWTKVLKMAKAGEADTDEDCDTEDHQGEQRRGSQET